MGSEGIEGVRRTLALYCHLMDDGAYHEAADLFGDDGRWTIQGTTHTGAQEIRELLSTWPSPAGHKHLTVNSVIDVDGDSATAVSDFVVVRPSGGGGVVVRGGRYHDTLVRRPGGHWTFASRENRGTSFVGDERP